MVHSARPLSTPQSSLASKVWNGARRAASGERKEHVLGGLQGRQDVKLRGRRDETKGEPGQTGDQRGRERGEQENREIEGEHVHDASLSLRRNLP